MMYQLKIIKKSNAFDAIKNQKKDTVGTAADTSRSTVKKIDVRLDKHLTNTGQSG